MRSDLVDFVAAQLGMGREQFFALRLTVGNSALVVKGRKTGTRYEYVIVELPDGRTQSFRRIPLGSGSRARFERYSLESSGKRS